MSHVQGLEILNDYQGNQKLVRKLPDWAATVVDGIGKSPSPLLISINIQPLKSLLSLSQWKRKSPVIQSLPLVPFLFQSLSLKKREI